MTTTCTPLAEIIDEMRAVLADRHDPEMTVAVTWEVTMRPKLAAGYLELLKRYAVGPADEAAEIVLRDLVEPTEDAVAIVIQASGPILTVYGLLHAVQAVAIVRGSSSQ